MFAEIAQVSHELRLTPLPYGLLPHEMIEIIDNERILPGISYLYKMGEDFPLLNHYNFTNIESPDGAIRKSNVNWQQRALLFDPNPGRVSSKRSDHLSTLIKTYKARGKDADQLLTFKDFHSIRYTFVSHLFDYYGQLADDPSFTERLKGIQSWFIWNIYKQLSSDFLDRASNLKYSEIEAIFKVNVMEKLKEKITEKIAADNKHANADFTRDVHFQIVSELS